MTKSKYRGGNAWVLVLCVLLVVLLLVGKSDSAKAFWSNVLWVFMLIIISVVLVTIFTYLSIAGDDLEYVNLLFFRHRIKIASILKIERFTNAVHQRRLKILYKRDDARVGTLMVYDAFSERTLRAFLNEIVRVNDRITLDRYYQELIAAPNIREQHESP